MIGASPKQITSRLYTCTQKSAAVKDMEITGRDRTYRAVSVMVRARHSNLE